MGCDDWLGAKVWLRSLVNPSRTALPFWGDKLLGFKVGNMLYVKCGIEKA